MKKFNLMAVLCACILAGCQSQQTSFEEEEMDMTLTENAEATAENTEALSNNRKNVFMAQGEITFGTYERNSIRLVMMEGEYYTLDETIPGVGTYDENYDGQYVLQLVDPQSNLLDEISLNGDRESEKINFPGEFEICIGDYNEDGLPDFTIGTAGSSSMNLFWIYSVDENGKIVNTGEISDVSKEFSIFPEQEDGSSGFNAVIWNNATGKEEKIKYNWNVEIGKYMQK